MKKNSFILFVLLFSMAVGAPAHAASTPAPAAAAAQQCSLYTSITPGPAGQACNKPAGYSAIDNSCCTAGVPAGGVCCGKQTVGTGSTDNSTNFVALTNIPLIEQAGNADNFSNFLNQLYKICIGLAAVLAVLQIIRAGIMYMGGDSVTEKSAARSLIVQSLLGLLLVLSPVIVFSIINPSILSLKIGRFDQLAIPSSAPADSFSNAPNPALCQSFDPSKYKTFIPPAMAGDSVCKNTLGAGYVKTDGQCCHSTDPAAICCGYDASQVPVAPPITSTGAYHYLALVGDSDSHPTCATEFPSSNFKTLSLCTADMNTTIKGGTKAVTQDCSGKVANSPATVYSNLSKLPACQ